MDDVCNRNRKLGISIAPTKAKSREPAYPQALSQNEIDREGPKSVESGRQKVRQLRRLWWSWDGKGGRKKRMTQYRICWRPVFVCLHNALCIVTSCWL